MPRLMLLFHSKGRHEHHRVHCQTHPSISDPSTIPVVRNYSYKMLEPPPPQQSPQRDLENEHEVSSRESGEEE